MYPYLGLVLIAGQAELELVLGALQRHRPVFHSEADFQHALAWEIQLSMPQARVRLETRPAPGVRLDLLVSQNNGSRTALELKYLTRAWTGHAMGERFELKNHGAQDIRAYDVIHDIHRVEQDTVLLPGCDGAVLVLTNDPAYWTPPKHARDTNAAAFRLYEGRLLAGSRAWGPNTGVGTLKGREAPIPLSGSYELRWRDFSTLPGPVGRFRLLIVEVVASAGSANVP